MCSARQRQLANRVNRPLTSGYLSLVGYGKRETSAAAAVPTTMSPGWSAWRLNPWALLWCSFFPIFSLYGYCVHVFRTCANVWPLRLLSGRFGSWCNVSLAVYVHQHVSAYLKEVVRRIGRSQRVTLQVDTEEWSNKFPNMHEIWPQEDASPARFIPKIWERPSPHPWHTHIPFLSLPPLSHPQPPSLPTPPSPWCRSAWREGIIYGGIPKSRNLGIIQKEEWKMMEYLRFYLKWLQKVWVLRVWICDRMSKPPTLFPYWLPN